MRRNWSLILVVLLVFSVNISSGQNVRSEIQIPDIPGYLTLKCDFHSHTVFSDGAVWPSIRIQEAWSEGLDAIAITDHLEYLPFKDDVNPNQNRSYELAKPVADQLGIILIHGTEITRSMPPGHFNAIFIKDATKINYKDWRKAIAEANAQGAFVFWNHPGWKAQAPDGAKWYPEHSELLEKGFFQGIEIVNSKSYYPVVYQWALEKNLCLLGNSDVHNAICYTFVKENGEHRPLTLVFAKERSAESIHEALLARRTAVYFEDKIFGAEKYLKEIFWKSIDVLTPRLVIKGKGRARMEIRNRSDLDFQIAMDKNFHGLNLPEEGTLLAGKIVAFDVKVSTAPGQGTKTFEIPFRVKNLLVAPDKGLQTHFTLQVEFVER